MSQKLSRSHSTRIVYLLDLGDGRVQGTVGGNPDWAIWGTWEYHILTVSGYGDLVRPENHVGG